MIMFRLNIDFISSNFSSCLLFWWSKVEPDLLMLDVSSTAALSSYHAPIPTINDPKTPLVNIMSLGRTGRISAVEQFLQKRLNSPPGVN